MMLWDKKAVSKLAAFDMDGTLLDGRVIYHLGQKFGFKSKIEEISKSTKTPYLRSQKIAKLLKGLTVSEFTETVEAIPLMKGAKQVTEQLKAENCIIGVISDSYTLATEIVVNRLKMDFHVANELEIKNHSFTGLLKMPMGWKEIDCSCRQSVCKRYHLTRIARRFRVGLSKTMAVGDSSADLCMIKNAGIGILFNPSEPYKFRNIEYSVQGRDLGLILRLF